MADKRIDRLKPPVWNPEKQNYNDWKFLVEMWSMAWGKAKLPKSDRGYILFQSLKDIQKDNIGNKLITEAQLDWGQLMYSKMTVLKRFWKFSINVSRKTI